MSYCRWTHDCDLYCYEDVTGGWTIHVNTGVSPRPMLNEPTLQAFHDRLLALRAEGYRFPDEVLRKVRAEMAGGS